jgi:hypothetical protein
LDPVAPPVRTKPAPPTATVEDLIEQLEGLRKQKADLERQEKEVLTKLQQKMRDQGDRLTKLGILPQAAQLGPQVPPGDRAPHAKK